MEVQAENAKFLGKDAFTMIYENFARHPEAHRDALIKWLPELEYMDLNATLMVKGRKVESIHDDGLEKLQRLVDSCPGIIDKINEYFEPKEELLKYWGYRLIKL